MFYNIDILNMRGGQFGLVWLVAHKQHTLDERRIRSLNNMLSKLDISRTSTEMLKYVNVAMPPPTPGDDRPRFSLYLSSILLCGTIQIHILQSDVFQKKIEKIFLNKINKAVAIRNETSINVPTLNTKTTIQRKDPLVISASIDFSFGKVDYNPASVTPLPMTIDDLERNVEECRAPIMDMLTEDFAEDFLALQLQHVTTEDRITLREVEPVRNEANNAEDDDLGPGGFPEPGAFTYLAENIPAPGELDALMVNVDAENYEEPTQKRNIDNPAVESPRKRRQIEETDENGNETLTAVSVSVCRLPQLDPVATDVPTRKRSSVVMGRPPIIDLNPKLSTQRLVGHRNQYNNHHVSEQDFAADHLNADADRKYKMTRLDTTCNKLYGQLRDLMIRRLTKTPPPHNPTLWDEMDSFLGGDLAEAMDVSPLDVAPGGGRDENVANVLGDMTINRIEDEPAAEDTISRTRNEESGQVGAEETGMIVPQLHIPDPLPIETDETLLDNAGLSRDSTMNTNLHVSTGIDDTASPNRVVQELKRMTVLPEVSVETSQKISFPGEIAINRPSARSGRMDDIIESEIPLLTQENIGATDSGTHLLPSSQSTCSKSVPEGPELLEMIRQNTQHCEGELKFREMVSPNAYTRESAAKILYNLLRLVKGKYISLDQAQKPEPGRLYGEIFITLRS